MNTKSDSSHEEAERLYAGIGKIIVRFQQVEMWLAEVLAGLLLMRDQTDRHLISSAMSYRQKVDLLIELYPKRKPKMDAKVDIAIVRKALYAAEEFRNRIVHSFWGIECGENRRWVRIKASLKGRNGFSVKTVTADTKMLEECADALQYVCLWMFADDAGLESATRILNQIVTHE